MFKTALKALPALSCAFALAVNAPAQTVDSAKSSPVHVSDSTLVPKDTTKAADTLSAAQKAMQSFQQRYKEMKKVEEEQKARFSFYDTLLACFASPRLNQRALLEQSFYHDAGDYFKFDPNYFVLDHIQTPMRKTVQPFGLSGDRLNVITNGVPTHPFEHLVEPDGLIDMNDIQTGLDHDVYTMPGPVGMLFGGSGAVASLVTESYFDTTLDAHSSFLVDKGWEGFANTRGKYSKRFARGRTIDMAIGYRQGPGDSSYNYDGDFYFPFGAKGGLRASGRLYSRHGGYQIRPSDSGQAELRSRFDRSLDVSWVKQNTEHTSRTEAGYSYLRQGSNINPSVTGGYFGRFNYIGHGLFASREWLRGATLVRAGARGGQLLYDDGIGSWKRRWADANFSMLKNKGTERYAAEIGSRYVESIKLLPYAAIAWAHETERFYTLASVGYSEREPSLHEIHLPFQLANVYSAGQADYADQGNPDLAAEEQLVGSLIMELGSADQALSLSATGGRILKGIDWKNVQDTPNAPYALFQPVNGNITFATGTLRKYFRLADFLRFNGGGSCHYLNYEQFRDKAYSPDYQFFTGTELHLYWRQKLVHFFGYGEASYIGPYHGYQNEPLGKKVIINGKLSFQMGHWRFYYIFQNWLNVNYTTREGYAPPGRFISYGFTWDFLN